MKKRIMTMTIIIMAICLIGCVDEKAASKMEVNEEAYIAETSSGDIIINCDEEGNPVEIIDANGEVIDLSEEEVKVERDENGDIVSVTVADQTVKVKEKATEENAEKILATAKETQEKKVAEKQEQKSEEKQSSEPASEKASEKKVAESNKEEEKLNPEVKASEPSSETKKEITSEEKKKGEEKASEKPSEKSSEKPSETPSEPTSEKSKPLVPTPEIMEKFAKEHAEEVERINEENYRVWSEDALKNITSTSRRDLFDKINDYRVEQGLEPYEWDSELENIALTRACEQVENMIINDVLDHGYGTPCHALENLCGGGLEPINAWKTSPGHNAALLSDCTRCVVTSGYVRDDVFVYVALFR